MTPHKRKLTGPKPGAKGGGLCNCSKCIARWREIAAVKGKG